MSIELPPALQTRLERMNADEFAVWLRVANRVAFKLVGEGRLEHGPLVLSEDRRDFLADAGDEAADALVYIEMNAERESR